MSEAYHQTVKGIYQYSQMNNFIALRNYIFIWQNDNRCLLLRFYNDFDHKITKLEYTVSQIDADGNIIKKNRITQENIYVEPGQTYSPNKGILVEEECVDFKLSVNSAYSDQYEYRVVDGMLVTYYEAPKKVFLRSVRRPSIDEEIFEFEEKRKRFGKPKRAKAVAILTLLLVFLLVSLQTVFDYVDLEDIIGKSGENKKGSNIIYMEDDARPSYSTSAGTPETQKGYEKYETVPNKEYGTYYGDYSESYGGVVTKEERPIN